LTAVFRINSPHVVAETLEGETTIVDLDSGTYYALNESGSLIWDGIIGGGEQGSVAARLRAAYELDEAEASKVVADLVAELTAAKLILPAEGAAANGAGPTTNGAGAKDLRGAFSTPKLSTYTDMQELLLLDPIHEVDETGWPAPG
jgi:Coenzyme PQQ synthesis protein D (PqqD)